MRLTREAIEWWWKGVKALGRGLGYKVWKSVQKYEVNLNMNRNFSKLNLFIWLNSEAEWFHLRDARQFAYVQLVGDSCKLESESWSYFSEVWGQGCEHEVILETEWGSGKCFSCKLTAGHSGVLGLCPSSGWKGGKGAEVLIVLTGEPFEMWPQWRMKREQWAEELQLLAW